MIKWIFFIVCIMVACFFCFFFGYSEGKRDAWTEYTGKEEYYEWLLDMKRREDYLDGREKPKKKRRFKK